jgi:cytochrome c556
MKKLAIVLVVLAAVAALSSPGQAQKERVFKKLMQQKLHSSQAMLEGLAMADFEKISQNADQLLAISNTEEWFVLKTAAYKLHSNEFRRAAEKVARKSKEKNIDGVALGYMELTLSCVRCHQYVREVRDVRHDRLPLPPAGHFGVADVEAARLLASTGRAPE